MRRPDKTGGKAGKPQRRRKTLKRRNTLKAMHRCSSSVTGRETNVARLSRELNEAFEQQAATAEILNIISNSPTDTQPAFDAIVQSGLKLFPDALVSLALRYGDMINAAAIAERDPERAEAWRRTISRTPLNREYMHGAALLDCRIVDVPDARNAPAEFSAGARNFLTSGYRAITITPMMRSNEAIGLLSVVRRSPGPLSDKQLSLLRTFAAQAVIAIENTRLLNELRQRTGDLSESLEQQTATSEVLKVISTSPGELAPVFESLLASAKHLCGAEFGIIFLREGDAFRTVALHGATTEYTEARWRAPLIRPAADTGLGRVLETKQVVQIADVRAVAGYVDNPVQAPIVQLAGVRSKLSVPMLKEEYLIGVIEIDRQEIRPFTDKQIELVTNFAAQAVIAIENTRLLNELRESLQQQTATADVLKVISRSTFDLQTVLDTLVKSAVGLCDGYDASILLREQDAVVLRAHYGPIPIDFKKWTLTRNWTAGRAIIDGKPVHIHDLSAASDEFPEGAAMARRLGHRTILTVPLLRQDEAIGALSIRRTEVRPFTEKQIGLLTIFADQAVIAIENVRLFNELRESLLQQTATADVLKVISRSTFDLQTVLDTLVESAARLCDADSAAIHRPKGDVYPFVASCGYSPEYERYMRGHPISPGRGSVLGRTLLEGKPFQIADIQADPDFTLTEQRRIGGYHTVLGVPLLRERIPIGVLVLTRSKVNPFTDKQIELATTFADQAVIAIENVRLFDEVQARTRELAQSLDDLRTTQDRLVQTQKLASLGQLTAGIAHEIKNPLNFVNNFSGVSGELIDELLETLKDPFDDKARTEINELAKTLRSNLDKIVQHGKRADTIVKNMLLHSREGSGEHRVIDVNTLVEESLNLAWHGARADTQGFEIKLRQSFDPSVGEADIFPQDIRRALLNMISNGFYAASRRRAETNGGDYEPTLTVSTKNLGDRVEIRIRDNGTGIAPDVKEKMFNPFFTTKPTGEGTGLGLSISHDIIVKQHGGSIEVDTQAGAFTEIRVILPRVVALLPER